MYAKPVALFSMGCGARFEWRPLPRHYKTARRVGSTATCLTLILGMFARQTQADVFLYDRIVNGPARPRQVIPIDGDFSDYAGQFIKRALHSFGAWADSLFPEGSPPAPASVTGAPRPWEAFDPAGPWSVVNLSNGNLFTRIPIAAWPGVEFNLYHNSRGNRDLNTLGGKGWLHSYSAHLEIDGNDVTYIADDGNEVAFTIDGDGDAENNVDHRVAADLWHGLPGCHRGTAFQAVMVARPSRLSW